MRLLIAITVCLTAAVCCGQDATTPAQPAVKCPECRKAWVDARIQAAKQQIQEQAAARREELKAELAAKVEAARQQAERNRQIQSLRDRIQDNKIAANEAAINSLKDRNWVRDRSARVVCQPPVVQAPPLPVVPYAAPSTAAPPVAQYQPPSTAAPPVRQYQCPDCTPPAIAQVPSAGPMQLKLPSRVGYTVSRRWLGGYKLKPFIY